MLFIYYCCLGIHKTHHRAVTWKHEWHHPQNWKYILITMLPKEVWAMVTGNMHKNLVKFSHVVFELSKRTDKQRDRQMDILIAIFNNPPLKTEERGLSTKHWMSITPTTRKIVSVSCKPDEVLLVQVTAKRTNTRRFTTELPQLQLAVGRTSQSQH